MRAVIAAKSSFITLCIAALLQKSDLVSIILVLFMHRIGYCKVLYLGLLLKIVLEQMNKMQASETLTVLSIIRVHCVSAESVIYPLQNSFIHFKDGSGPRPMSLYTLPSSV